MWKRMNFFRAGLVVIILMASITLSGCGFREKNTDGYRITLEVWGIFDESDAFSMISKQYRDFNPNIEEIRYKKFAVDNYRQDLIDALASGNGPDIFLIRNSWVPAFEDKIVVAPDGLIEDRTFRDVFVDTVSDDFITKNGKFSALPLSVDSLALYYNKDLFAAAGITTPPRTWEEFQEDVRLLTRINPVNGEVIQAGVALGTADNINRSTDILQMLLIQNGAIAPRSSGGDMSSSAGAEAMRFYTQFADPLSSLYTWNPSMHYSIDTFYEGRLAMMLNYSWHYETVKRKNAKLNFAVAPLPQPSNGKPFNFPNYWAFAVAKNKLPKEMPKDPALFTKVRVFESWQFLKYMTFPNNGTVRIQNAVSGVTKDFSTIFDPAEEYLKKTKKPSARRDLIEKQKSDSFLGPFADGNLLARSWQQSDPESIERILGEAITSVNLGKASVGQSLGTASSRITRVKD